MAARRQQQKQWEAQLKEKAFLSATTKPIVDETVNYKPPIPYALRQVKRSMDRGIHFRTARGETGRTARGDGVDGARR